MRPGHAAGIAAKSFPYTPKRLPRGDPRTKKRKIF